MKRIATIVKDGRVIGLLHGPDHPRQFVTVRGRKWRFDFDEVPPAVVEKEELVEA